MLRNDSLIERHILSIIDHFGCQCTPKQLVEFVQTAKQLNARCVGKQTYVLCDLNYDPQSYGQVAHLVVMMPLDSNMSITQLCAYLIDQTHTGDVSAA
jgi:hypothetical protein